MTIGNDNECFNGIFTYCRYFIDRLYFQDSPLLLQQNRDLQMAILSIKEESYRRRSEEMRKRLARMKPITGIVILYHDPAHLIQSLKIGAVVSKIYLSDLSVVAFFSSP